MSGFSFLDHVVKLVTVSGREYRVLSGDGFEMDPGASVDHIPGFGQLPFGIVRKGAKPKFKGMKTTCDEIRTMGRFIGEIGGSAFKIVMVIHRPGSILWHLELQNCDAGEGWGWKTGDSGTQDDWGGAMTEVRYSFDGSPLRSIFAKPNGR